MKKNYCFSQVRFNWFKLTCTALLALSASAATQAQRLNYNLYGIQSGTLQYTDLGAASLGTVISTPNTDDANSAPQNIGFTFNYNGQNFTQFVLNTNGFIKLGSTAPTGSYFFDGAQTAYGGPFDSSDANLLVPFNEDLQAGTSPAEYRVFTTGSAPNRVCVIQWKNVQDKARAAAPGQTNVGPIYTNMQFQVRLYETANIIDFVYGPFTGGTSTDIKWTGVGIKGTNGSNGNLITAVKQSIDSWSAPSFQESVYKDASTYDAFNVRSSLVPTSGLVYRFNPAQSNDLVVNTIYTLGKLATSVSLPHAVSTAVTNVGLATQTNVPVTLAVTGSNTFTSTKNIASIAPGATAVVTFDAYPATLAQGTNNLTVGVPADDSPSNNTQTFTQQVTSNTVSYINDGQPTTSPLGYGQANFALATKFTNAKAISVSQVKLTFATSPSSATYQVLIYDATGTGGTPGKILFTSPTRTRTTAAATETVNITPTPVSGNFYVAVKELDSSIDLGYQTEAPLRNDTFYFTFDGTTWNSLTSANLPTRLAVEATFTTVTANSPELKRAISIYPNPSTGTVTLDVRGVAAKNALQVQISNALGQTVYTGTVRSEAANTLDLSTLASGIYTLKVQNGDQYTIEKLTIQ